MDVSTVAISGASATAINTAGGSAPQSATADQPLTAARDVAPFTADGIDRRDDRAAEIFRAELSRSAESDLKVRLKAADTPYAEEAAGDLDDTVSDTLRATDRLVADKPDVAVRVVLRARQSVETAARVATESVTVGDSVDDVESAVRDLSSGLDRIEESAGRQLESSASVLSVDTQLRQRSALRIRTQEGDIVSLSLSVQRRLSANDVAVNGDGFSLQQTEVSYAGRSRLSLRVEGDLNDAELAAIRSVVLQAKDVADEFFAGDLGAALSAAGELEFDASQLSRVNLRLRSSEVSNVSFAQATVRQPVAEPAPEPAIVEAAPVSRPAEVETAAPRESAPVVSEPVEEAPVVQPAVVEEDAAVAVLDPDPVASFLDLLAAFMQRVSEGYEPRLGDGSFRLHFSQSFKMQILKSVFELVSPNDPEDDAAAVSLIDAAAEAGASEDADD